MAPTPIHPGEHLAEELEELGMSAAELARQIEVPVNRITEIINGQRSVTADSALRLGLVRNQRGVLAQSAEDRRDAAGSGARWQEHREASPSQRQSAEPPANVVILRIAGRIGHERSARPRQLPQ